MSRSFPALVLSSAAVFLATPARAADSPDPNIRAAAILMHDAKKEGDAGHYEAARKLYAKACAIAPTPRCLRSLAFNELKSGHAVDALHHFRQELASPTLTADVPAANLAIDKDHVKEAYAQTGHLEVQAPDGATLVVDGMQLAEPLPPDHIIDLTPGTHQLEARQGDQVARAEATTTAGTVVTVELRPQPPPAPPPPLQQVGSVAPPAGDANLPPSAVGSDASSSWWTTPHTVGVITAGAGVVAFAVSGVFASQAHSQAQTVDQQRPCFGPCPALQAAASQQHTDFLLDWTFVGVGAAAVATGAVLMLWPTHKGVAPTASTNSVGLQLSGDF